MKKTISAIFLALIVVLLPLTTNAVKIDVEKLHIANTNQTPQLFITTIEKSEIDQFIESNFEGEKKDEARNILEGMLIYDSGYKVYEVIVDALTKSIEDYSYYHVIPEDVINNVTTKEELIDLINNYWNFSRFPFGKLIDKIIEILKSRLGWIYELFVKSATLFIDGMNLAKKFIVEIQNLEIAKLFVIVINTLILIPIYYFTTAVKSLFNLDLENFTSIIREFIEVFSADLMNLTVLARDVLSMLGEMFKELIDYLNKIIDFIDWINTEPWKERIIVKGKAVNLLGTPFVGTTVTCRGVSSDTDSNGEFNFTVYPSNTSVDSFPPYSWYGLHNCTIVISKDGEILKHTPFILSYVFSGGTMECIFVLPKARSRNINHGRFLNRRSIDLLARLNLLKFLKF